MKNTRKRLSLSLGSLVLSLGMAFASLLPSPVMAEDGNAVLQELKGFIGEELRKEANRRLGEEKICRVSDRAWPTMPIS